MYSFIQGNLDLLITFEWNMQIMFIKYLTLKQETFVHLIDSSKHTCLQKADKFQHVVSNGMLLPLFSHYN